MDAIAAAAAQTRSEWVRKFLPRLLEESREGRREVVGRELMGRLRGGFWGGAGGGGVEGRLI